MLVFKKQSAQIVDWMQYFSRQTEGITGKVIFDLNRDIDRSSVLGIIRQLIIKEMAKANQKRRKK